MTKYSKTTSRKLYVDPIELKAEVVLSQKQKYCSEKLADMLIKIGNAVLDFPKFRNLKQDVKDELLSTSLYKLLKRGIYRIDVEKNIFAYLTQAHYLNMMCRNIQLCKHLVDRMKFEAEFYKLMGMQYTEYELQSEED